jgi:membrane protease YdiL (CAAX protease family)
MSDSAEAIELNPPAPRGLPVWQAVLLFIAFYVSQLVAGGVFLAKRHGLNVDAIRAAMSSAEEVQSVLLVSAAATSIAFLGLLVWFSKRRGLGFADFGLVRPQRKWFVAALILLPIAYSAGALAEWLSGEDLQAESLAASAGFISHHTFLTIATAFVVILLMPFIEELFFRATLYGALRKYMRPVFAGLLATVFFVAIHAQYTLAGGVFALVATLQLALLALMLMWLYVKSGSLWPSFALHAANNAISFVAAYYYFHHSAT